MNTKQRKAHWEKIYRNKHLEEVSWYQPHPEVSIDFIRSFDLPLDASFIDIGGGDSYLVDHLLDMGYKDITVLDISEKAISKAKKRLGHQAAKVKWIVSDILDFLPQEKYDLWHDRAALHFLTDDNDIQLYMDHLARSVYDEGYAVIGTFSTDGPDRCSGLNIQQYSEESLDAQLNNNFKKLECKLVDHETPFGDLQQFLFCGFQKY